jgi:hypothetical protein
LEATRLVNRLFVQLAFSRDVVKHLESDRALPAALRDAAIRLAESRGDDPQQLEGRSWSIAKAPNGESTTYRLAVRCAELSAHLAPWESRFITTLGAAYYRVGEYERSLTILTRQGSRPSGENRLETAFIAMAHHRLGHATTARALVDDLRGPLENRSREPFREIQDLPALLREAETTLASPATGTRHAASPRSGAS